MSFTLALSVFGASLLGSLHCAGMCGPFVGIYAGGNPGRSWQLHVSYNVGRLLTYVVLGAVAGALGQALDLAAAVLGFAEVAALASGLLIAAFGLAGMLGARGPTQAGPFERVLQRLARPLLRVPPLPRATLLGLSSTFLPCGWLYAFAVAAAGTGSPSNGALLLGVFWLGTLPMLLGLGFGMQKLSHRLRGHATLLGSAILLVLGIATIAGRVNLPAFSVRAAVVAPEAVPLVPPCH